MREVQAFILNISFPKNLDEILDIEEQHGIFDIEYLLDAVQEKELSSWTAPKWCKSDDIVFFMHAKTSRATIVRLKNQLERESGYQEEERVILSSALERGSELYERFGGKIFAIGRVIGRPRPEDPSDLGYEPHWRSQIYVDVGDCCLLGCPADLSEFRSFIQLSRGGSITPVFGKEFDMLKDLIMKKNAVPPYLEESVSMLVPLAKVDEEDWIQVSSKYRRNFLYESQFRTFYVDHLLSAMGDMKKIFIECPCDKPGHHISYVDNVILIGGRYLPVEVKLAVSAERDLPGQVRKYCRLHRLTLDQRSDRIAPPDKVYSDGVLVIDTDSIYWYSALEEDIRPIWSLDDISGLDDILDLRHQIIALMGS